MARSLTFLFVYGLMVLFGGCHSSASVLVNMDCDSVTTCLPLPSLGSSSIPVLNAGCNVITAAPLRELIQNDDFVTNARDEIVRRFELSVEELTTETYDRSIFFTWWYLGNRHTLYIQEGEKPVGYVFFEKSKPLLKQIIACLGEPEWYTSAYGPGMELWAFNVELYFPKYGVVAKFSQMDQQKYIVIHEDLTTTFLRLAPSATIEGVVSFLEFDSPEVAQIILEQLKPWPGSMEVLIETIQADYCLDYPEFCPTDEP